MPPIPKRCKLYNDGCLNVLRGMKPNSVDAVVTDPPYGLKFMGKDWDHGIPGITFWAHILRVCKPGAMLLAFGGTRTYHRLACAIEDAGWEIRDCLMWVYGSGFPKSHDISKAIDKAAGVAFKAKPASGVGFMTPEGKGGYNVTKNQLERVGASTKAAKTWDGYGTGLKPSYEPVLLAMKPLDGTFAQNAQKWGVAGLNIEDSRIGYESAEDREKALAGDAFKRKDTSDKKAWARPWMEDQERVDRLNEESKERAQSGRWPANLILSHHPECVRVAEDWKCHPDCPMLMFPETSTHKGTARKTGNNPSMFGNILKKGVVCSDGDSGSAARFFYCAKASKRERTMGGEITNAHPTVKPSALMEYLCKLVKPPGNGVILDPFMGSGTTGVACAKVGCNFIGVENDTEHGYFEVAKKRIEAAYEKERGKQTRRIKKKIHSRIAERRVR